MSFLEDLFYGRINPFSRTTEPGGKAEEMNQRIAKAYERLSSTLEPNQKEMLLDLMDRNGEANTIERLDCFIVGFQLGAACIFDVIRDDTAPYCDAGINN